MKDNKPKDNKHKEIERYRLSGISAKEIKAKYPDKLVDAYVEGERLVLVLDTCRIKFDERIPQKNGASYGSIH
jgi:hypothetical protein|tara:strand:- start:1015 stop:1233 length:219 start_codon:yes stop_codon:yes gene_type:complete